MARSRRSSPVVVNPVTDVTVGSAPTITWTAPVTPGTPAPATYTVAVTGPSGFTALSIPGLTGLSTTLPTTLPLGSFSVTVLPVYGAGSGVTGTVSSARTFAVRVSTLIEQEITVSRPLINALILTQRCQVNSLIPGEDPTSRFPLVTDIPATTGLGTAPFKVVNGVPTTQVTNFGEYPVPTVPDYPTRCGLNLPTPQLITSGALRGQYFTTTGALSQVTVADFRNADVGWVLTGTMGTFTDGVANSGNFFSGNYLGWNPVTPIVSLPTSSGYTQTVAQGANVEPGTGTGGSFGGTGGLGAGQTLATSQIPAPVPPNATTGLGGSGGTGIADLNARVKLLIPTTANAATYKGILTFTIA